MIAFHFTKDFGLIGNEKYVLPSKIKTAAAVVSQVINIFSIAIKKEIWGWLCRYIINLVTAGGKTDNLTKRIVIDFELHNMIASDKVVSRDIHLL